ncbi:DUF4191 domain-containing protein [Bifidobacterium callitrichos]|uniref:DUF4191 domain-containing protein n=2 Tax=Bifidobacterium callitrichos TaxID=762209 RepID=A0A2T3GDI0_9BIFI|nr:DUF4191 domain-containing protein [Bifidobacterium callitrichos]KFI51345.1 membrane protein [Bifidobacterium callitrichos DSM 23973]PST47534.1 DUF4191 domain-containing protein [Bifidobacterium callitrichos]
MADKDEKKPKKQSTIKQIIQIYKYTVKDDKQLPWLLAGAILAPIVVAVIIGLIFQWNWLNWIFIIIAAIMLGLLFGTMTLTNRADKVGYRQLEGRPGAAIGVLSNMNKAGFNFPEQPVWVDPRTKDAIWRGTGYNGIYLLGEGDYGRVNRQMDREERAIKGVTAGSQIPVYRILVGNGPKQTKLSDLRKTVTRQKSYVPIQHKSKLMDKIHPRRRFMLTKEELAILNDRLRTLQMKSGYGIPKGVDPNRVQKVSRRAMRGK